MESYPEGLEKRLPELLAGLNGMKIVPLVYCGHQLVNGRNYMFICECNFVAPNPRKSIIKLIVNDPFPTKDEEFGKLEILLMDTINNIERGIFLWKTKNIFKLNTTDLL